MAKRKNRCALLIACLLLATQVASAAEFNHQANTQNASAAQTIEEDEAKPQFLNDPKIQGEITLSSWLVTLLVLSTLAGGLYYLKKNPNLLQDYKKKSGNKIKLVDIARPNHKLTLYLIECGQEKILLAQSGEQLVFKSLNAEPVPTDNNVSL